MDILIRFYLYLINNNFDDFCYVGRTCNPKDRWRKHLKPSKKEQHKHLYRSMAAHGKEKFYFTILEKHETFESVKQAEIDVIKMFKDTGVRLYNHSDGGEGTFGYKHTVESRIKMSEAHKGLQAGDKNPRFGKPVSDEQRAKTSKPIIMITQELEQIEFPSISECARFISSSSGKINAVLKGKRNNVGGYVFAYKNMDSTTEQIYKCKQTLEFVKIRNRPIILITAEGDEIEFESTTECVKFTNCPYSDITRVLNGERKTSMGFTFKYKELN